MSDVDRSLVAVKAKEFVDSKKYTYKQFRGAGRKTDSFMDCSEFVYQSYQSAGFLSFPALSTGGMSDDADDHDQAAGTTIADKAKATQGGFFWIEMEADVTAGDIVYWPGHVGIVEAPDKGTFLAAASTKSGLREDNYKTGIYWSKRSGRTFIRYLPPPSSPAAFGPAN